MLGARARRQRARWRRIGDLDVPALARFLGDAAAAQGGETGSQAAAAAAALALGAALLLGRLLLVLHRGLLLLAVVLVLGRAILVVALFAEGGKMVSMEGLSIVWGRGGLSESSSCDNVHSRTWAVGEEVGEVDSRRQAVAGSPAEGSPAAAGSPAEDSPAAAAGSPGLGGCRSSLGSTWRIFSMRLQRKKRDETGVTRKRRRGAAHAGWLKGGQ